MFTATLYLPSDRKKNEIEFSQRFKNLRRRFSSKIIIQRGDSKPLDITSDKQLNEFVRNRSHVLHIVVEGKDEMIAASELVDFFNHGGGI